MLRRQTRSTGTDTLLPYTSLFRSDHHRTVDRAGLLVQLGGDLRTAQSGALIEILQREEHDRGVGRAREAVDRQTRELHGVFDAALLKANGADFLDDRFGALDR